MPEDEIEIIEKKYGHLIVVFLCSFSLIVIVLAALTSHWFSQRLLSDFWPVDKSSVAPNILASIVIFDLVTLAASLFYPPFKKALDRGFSRHKEELKGHINAELTALRADAQRHHEEQLDQRDAHHKELTALAKEHHAKQLRAIRTARASKEDK